MPPQTWSNPSEPGRLAPGARLLACLAAVGAAWLWALPQIAKTPSVRQMIDRNESLGIDPSAKFYSELALMLRVMERIRNKRSALTWEGEAPAEPRSVYQRSARQEPRPPALDQTHVTLDSSLCSE